MATNLSAKAPTAPTNREILRVAVASIIGSVIEQYDFLVTGIIAATIWPALFFKPSGAAFSGVASAIAVYGLGIMIRPLGAYIFGNLADRLGRKDAMVYALLLMGFATLAIGLTPTYAQIGPVAPALLLVFRLIQGISFGAEFGTASTWVVEQAAKSKYRAFWGAWVGFAIPLGLLLGFGSVFGLRAAMSPADYASWGWRIFFFVGFLVAIVGIIIRTRTEESYVFEKYSSTQTKLAYPANRVWAEMGGKILLSSLVNAMFSGCFFLSFVYGQSYMRAVGFTPNQATEIGLLAAAFMLVFMFIGSLLADRISRKTILLIAAVVFFIFAIPYFYLIGLHEFLLAVVAEVIGFGFVFGFGYGAIPAFYTEAFPTRYRASGASAGYQMSQIYGGGLIPILAGIIQTRVGIGNAYIYIGLIVMVYAAAAIAVILTMRDTTRHDLEIG